MLIREDVLRKSPSSGKVPSKPSQASSLAGHLLQLHHGLGDTSWTCGGRQCIFQISVSPIRLCPHRCCYLQLRSSSIQQQHSSNSSRETRKIPSPLSHSHFLEFLALSLLLRRNKTHFSLTDVFRPRKNKSAKFSHFSARFVTNFFYRQQLITFQFFPPNTRNLQEQITLSHVENRARLRQEFPSIFKQHPSALTILLSFPLVQRRCWPEVFLNFPRKGGGKMKFRGNRERNFPHFHRLGLSRRRIFTRIFRACCFFSGDDFFRVLIFSI